MKIKLNIIWISILILLSVDKVLDSILTNNIWIDLSIQLALLIAFTLITFKAIEKEREYAEKELMRFYQEIQDE